MKTNTRECVSDSTPNETVAPWPVWMAQWIGAREQQEDHSAVLDPPDAAFRAHAGVLAVVADGMGGMAHGETASRVAIASFLRAWEEKVPSESTSQALSRSMAAANRAVSEEARAMGSGGEMGCTLIATAVRDKTLEWTCAGDSALLLLRDGELTQLNTPHTFAEQLDREVAQGERSLAQASRDPQRAALTSFLGLEGLPLVDRTVRPFPLRDGDLVVLATDGLTNTLSETDIVQVLDSAGPDADLSSELIEAVKRRDVPGQDNTTVVVLRAGQQVAAPVPDPVVNLESVGVDQLREAWTTVADGDQPRPKRRLQALAKLAAFVLAAAVILLGIFFGPGPFGRGNVDKFPVPDEDASSLPAQPSRQPADAGIVNDSPNEEAPGGIDGARKSPFGDDAGRTPDGEEPVQKGEDSPVADSDSATPSISPAEVKPVNREER